MATHPDFQPGDIVRYAKSPPSRAYVITGSYTDRDDETGWPVINLGADHGSAEYDYNFIYHELPRYGITHEWVLDEQYTALSAVLREAFKEGRVK